MHLCIGLQLKIYQESKRLEKLMEWQAVGAHHRAPGPRPSGSPWVSHGGEGGQPLLWPVSPHPLVSSPARLPRGGSVRAWFVLWQHRGSQWFALVSDPFLQLAHATCAITTILITSNTRPVQRRQVSEPGTLKPTISPIRRFRIWKTLAAKNPSLPLF